MNVQWLLRIGKGRQGNLWVSKIAHGGSRRRFVLHGPIQSRRNIHGLWKRAIYNKYHEKSGFGYNPVLRLDLDDVPGIYPVQVPLYIDALATADRKSPKVSELAREIVSADSNAVVISNGGDDEVERVITFQKVKGQNGLQNKKYIFVILNNLSPAQYAKLNVVGQWLNIPDIIALYYEDQINQAVGRNRGFRDNGATKTVIIASNRLYRSVLHKIGAIRGATCTQMYKVSQRPW